MIQKGGARQQPTPHDHDGAADGQAVRWILTLPPCWHLVFPLLPDTSGSPLTSAPFLLGLIKLLVIKVLIFLVIRLNQRVISSVGELEVITIAEVAIDR